MMKPAPSDWTKHFWPWFAVPLMWPVLAVLLGAYGVAVVVEWMG